MNNSPTYSYQLFSPLLQQRPSPFLSPFPNLRKVSDDFSDLVSFKLEQDPLSLNFPDCEPPSPSNSNHLLHNDFALHVSEEPAPPQEEEDVNSPAHSHRCEMPSTRFH
jgi:hypothetical protein